MKNRIVSVHLSVLLTVTCVISFAYGEEQVDNNFVQDSPSYTILSHNQLGNTFHRMTSETVTEDGISYLKLTPTTDALVPKIDKYGLNLDLSPYNYIKIRYKTTLENYSMLFDVMKATSFSTDLTFTVPQSDVWVSQILPIYTTNTSVLNQYHFSVFGNNNASALQGEEFCIEYIGFFDKYATALNYRNVETDVKSAPAGLGEDYIITGKDFCDNLSSVSDPTHYYTFSSEESENYLKLTLQENALFGKMQFSPQAITGKYFVRGEYDYVKLRFKYIGPNVEDGKINMIEGYSAQSTYHTLGNFPVDAAGKWNEYILPVTWSKSDSNHRHIITLLPLKSSIQTSATILLDYVGFFKTEQSALNYVSERESSFVITGDEFAAKSYTLNDPEGNLTLASRCEQDGSYKVTFKKASDVGKIEFRTNSVSDRIINKNRLTWLKIRYKYNFSNMNGSYAISIREGYSSQSTNHIIAEFNTGLSSQWQEKIIHINWLNACEGDNVFTLHPTRDRDEVQVGDSFYIDYIGFFDSQEAAQEYERPQYTPPNTCGKLVFSPNGTITINMDSEKYGFAAGKTTLTYSPTVNYIYSSLYYLPKIGKIAINNNEYCFVKDFGNCDGFAISVNNIIFKRVLPDFAMEYEIR